MTATADRLRGAGGAPHGSDRHPAHQIVLSWAGAVLLGLGLVVIALGWSGAASTRHQYDQVAYVISGGLLGLGLTVVGGFLYFGTWVARIADEARESSMRVATTLHALTDESPRSTIRTSETD